MGIELLNERQQRGLSDLRGDVGEKLAVCRDTMRKELDDAKHSMRLWCIGVLITALTGTIVGIMALYTTTYSPRLERVEEQIDSVKETTVRIETQLETLLPGLQEAPADQEASP